MGNIISNALAYIDQPKGFVHIIVDDVPSLLPPSGYADLSLKKNVSIQIQDSGIGMDREYLEYHYFRPMKKENELRPGSGLSVHIAQRLVNVLGGNIAVSSQSGMASLCLFCPKTTSWLILDLYLIPRAQRCISRCLS